MSYNLTGIDFRYFTSLKNKSALLLHSNIKVNQQFMIKKKKLRITKNFKESVKKFQTIVLDHSFTIYMPKMHRIL